jgi:hypothetical protein
VLVCAYASKSALQKHGVGGGFPGFMYYSDTLSFFRYNRQNIVKNMELLVEELGEDSISMV